MDDRVRNEVVRERVGVPEKLSGRVDRKVLKWFGHVERMGSERMTKRVYMSEVEGQRGRGRPPLRWKDGVRRACAEREMGLDEARGLCLDHDAGMNAYIPFQIIVIRFNELIYK